MTTNQFHRRVLPPNPGLPISPNVETFRRKPPPPKPFTVILNLQFSGVPGGHSVHISRPNLLLQPGGVNNWNTLAVADEGWPMIISADYFPLTPSLEVSMLADYGSGYLPVDHTLPTPFDGQTPYESPILSWVGWTGRVVIFGQGEFIY